MEHVTSTGPTYSGCLFEPPGDDLQNKELLLLYRDSLTVVLLNRFPYANGHLLVAPVKHVSCITQLSDSENNGLSAMVKKSADIIKRQFNPDGMNIGMNIGAPAGAGIADHLHVHIVPRWDGDHNFMTVLGEIRTIPQHIEKTWDILAPYFIE